MRSIRALGTALTVLSLLPCVATAQKDRQFKDAWFWGVKAGGLSFADASGAYKMAPLAGGEWLLTRTHGGLLISLSQAFMSTTTIFPAGPESDSLRTIDLKN